MEQGKKMVRGRWFQLQGESETNLPLCKIKHIAWTLKGNFVKLNFDGSKKSNDESSFGYIIWDSNANLMTLGFEKWGSFFILTTKILGLRQGLFVVK